MQFKITKADAEWAEFNIIVELLAQMRAMEDLIVDMHAKSTGKEFTEAKAEYQSRVSKHRDEINDQLDADYGKVDMEELK